MRASLVVISVIALLSPAAIAFADDPVTTAQALIARQIDAFLHDDAATAYSLAAPGIAALYPDKDSFIAMVKKNYKPVYHPGNYAFGKGRAIDDGAIVYQQVLITGIDAKDWTAIYQLMRQPDGTYKISGVQVVPNTESRGI
jgi:hypothetical protein